MRKRLYEIIEYSADGDKASRFYDALMLFMIILSLVPLASKELTPLLAAIELTAILFYILDYIARWITADFRLGKGARSFLIHPFTPMAVVDLLSILPVFTLITGCYPVLNLFLLGRVVRIFRYFRYSRNFHIISEVIRRQKGALVSMGVLAVGYVLLCALLIFNVEPQTFDTFFDAVYWATMSLTTVGYGDIYPVTALGRVVTMVSSVVGIAVVALPAGSITAGYLEVIKRETAEENARNKEHTAAEKTETSEITEKEPKQQ